MKAWKPKPHGLQAAFQGTTLVQAQAELKIAANNQRGARRYCKAGGRACYCRRMEKTYSYWLIAVARIGFK